ncbi:DNA/RNA non-specific endonuclease [Flavobacteriaceae bacterium F89]|uniref:Endonuclease n=1 Tax=Cerina litoralis TaxID=2874477 RepID=A0AAE3JQ22_9FLAO|nr:DNA/RNA non-specific endonuclease [Cerina litoralis]MCG2462705.1 DNA/RNA non-specific endonuclease [Cerina litoralis]
MSRLYWNWNKGIYTVLLIICIIGFWLFENFYLPHGSTREETIGPEEIIPAEFLPSSTTGVIVDHAYFSLSYDEPYEQAEWVAYMLNRKQLTHDNRKRPYFVEDPLVKTRSADWRNYKNSGYDRGHLCPAGDRRFSKQAYDETFYTSNISPQNREFNAGVWNRLEQTIRHWANDNKRLFVVTGGVLEKGLPTIGREQVAVPEYFYKIVAVGPKGSPKVIAFLLPNEESKLPLRHFVVSVDRVEKMTKINFFSALPYEVQEILESKVVLEDWQF